MDVLEGVVAYNVPMKTNLRERLLEVINTTQGHTEQIMVFMPFALLERDKDKD